MISAAPAAHAEWPPSGLEPVLRCPACGESARTLMYDGVTDRTYLCAPGRWSLYRCAACASAYLDPRPSAETAHLAYASYYEGAAPRETLAALRGWRRVRRALRNGYLNSRFGYRAAPAWRLGAPLVRLVPRLREQADASVRHLHLPPGEARLLDVGCGEGDFLVDAALLGWDAEGLEPSPEAQRLAEARGARVVHGTLDATTLPPETFDAITFRLVFEHLHDPIAALRKCHEALKPGGVLWLASPNLESTGHRRFGRDWIYLETPRHAVLYTPSSLTRLLARTGFELLDLRPSREARWSFRMSAAIANGVPPFAQTPPFDRRLAWRARLADLRALRRPELAEVMILVARKP